MKLPAAQYDDSGPNLTPVIDVVFLLLIFFLVATTYEQAEKELEVDIPESAKAQPYADTRDLVVNILRDGTVKIEGKTYDVRRLRVVIAKARENNPTQRVFIRADGDSALRHAVTVMGFCNDVEMPYRVATIEQS